MRPVERIGILLLLLASGSAAAQSPALKDVRVWGSPDSTRVVLDLTAPTSYTLFSLSGP
jgi:N-acetylmuramoyl-L-alanine amidase